MRKEFLTALLIGLSSGTLVGGIVWVWRKDVPGALVIGGSIAISLVSACLVGLCGSVALAPVQARSENRCGTGYARSGGHFCARDLFHERLAGFAMSAVSVIIPALNEEEPIADVVREVRRRRFPLKSSWSTTAAPIERPNARATQAREW